MMIKKIKFCHLKVCNMSLDEVLSCIKEAKEEKEHLSIGLLSLSLFIKSIFSKKTKTLLNSIDILIPNTLFLFFLIKLIHKKYSLNFSDVRDIVSLLIIRYNHDTTYVFVGSSLNSLSLINKNLKMSFKEIKILGLYPEEFLETKPDEVFEVLRKIEPNIVFIDFKEERVLNWIKEKKEFIKKSIVVLCKNRLKIMGGEKSDIPYKYKKRNLDFLYKVMSNPLNLLKTIVLFIVILYTLIYYLINTLKKNKE